MPTDAMPDLFQERGLDPLMYTRSPSSFLMMTSGPFTRMSCAVESSRSTREKWAAVRLS